MRLHDIAAIVQCCERSKGRIGICDLWRLSRIAKRLHEKPTDQKRKEEAEKVASKSEGYIYFPDPRAGPSMWLLWRDDWPEDDVIENNYKQGVPICW